MPATVLPIVNSESTHAQNQTTPFLLPYILIQRDIGLQAILKTENTLQNVD